MHSSLSATALSIFIAVVASQSTNTVTAPPAGSTLSSGAYVCNPAHAYPSGQSCDDSNGTPTLVTVTASNYAFGSTLSNGGYVCNPAHSYPGDQSCDGSKGTPTLVTLKNTSSTSVKSVGTTAASVSGAYVCNPAHSYPVGQSCDGSGPTPTLVSSSSAKIVATGTGRLPTASTSGVYIPKYTGAAGAIDVPALGAVAFGLIAILA